MSTKQKDKPKAVTTITLRITEETGEVGYKATVAVTRGAWGHVGQFEYFEARHMTEAIEEALAKLEAIERQPPQVSATSDDASPTDAEPDDDLELADDTEDIEDEAVSEADSPTRTATAFDTQPAQPGLI